jgi:hypothetical protein
MMEPGSRKQVLIYKTSVPDMYAVARLRPYLDHLVQHSDWTFDLGDADKVLRIETDRDICNDVISLLRTNGYYCCVLED